VKALRWNNGNKHSYGTFPGKPKKVGESHLESELAASRRDMWERAEVAWQEWRKERGKGV